MKSSSAGGWGDQPGPVLKNARPAHGLPLRVRTEKSVRVPGLPTASAYTCPATAVAGEGKVTSSVASPKGSESVGITAEASGGSIGTPLAVVGKIERTKSLFWRLRMDLSIRRMARVSPPL